MGDAQLPSHALSLATLTGQLADVNTARLLSRSGQLVEHLDDPLVRVFDDVALVGTRPPLRVCTFRQAQGSTLFAVLDDHGWVTIGRIDDPAKRVRLRLHLFDRTKQDVVALVPSRFDQRGGSITDLWVLGREDDPILDDQARYWAYHGWVSLDREGWPQLDPAPDHPDDVARRAWRCQSVDLATFPLLMQRFCVSAGEADDLFHPDADRDAAVLEQRGSRVIALVAWSPGALVWVEPADTVRVQAFGRTHEQPRTEAVRAVAVEGRRQGAAPTRGRPHAALERLRWVVADDAQLEGFEWAQGEAEPRQVWAQRLEAPPRGVALHTGDSDAWPEVLVAFRNGTLACFRHVGGKVREVWHDLWASLDAHEGHGSRGERLAWIRQRLSSEARDSAVQSPTDDRRVRQALLLRATELILEGAALPETSAEQSDEWRNTWALLIGREESDGVRWPVAELLAQHLRQWVLEETPNPFLPTFLRDIYRGPAEFMPAPLPFQERIDVVVRGLEHELRRRGGAACRSVRAFGDLCADARRSAVDLWEGDTPQRGAEGNARLAGIGFERWANRFVLTDALPAAALELRRPTQVVFLRGCKRGWLALAEGVRLVLVELSESGKVQEGDLASDASWDTAGAVITHLAVLAGGDQTDRLLVGLSDGRLCVCQVDEHAVPARLIPQRDSSWRASREAHDSGPLSALATLALPSGGWLLVCGLSGERGSSVHLAQLDTGGGLVLRGPEPINPGQGTLRSLDIACAGPDTFQVLLGEGDQSRAELRRVGPDLRTQGTPLVRDVDSRVLAMRFDSAVQPRYAAIGDRAGLVWGVDLQQATDGPAAIQRLTSIYQLQGPICALEPFEQDEPVSGDPPRVRRHYFLAASEAGHITLLDAESGRRVWKHRLPAPLRAMTLAARGPWPTPLMALTLADGTLHVFSYLRRVDRERAFDQATTFLSREDVQAWCRSHDAPCRRADQEIVTALARMSEGTQTPHEILRSMRFRSARAQFLRYLVERVDPRSLNDGLRHDLVQAMTYRDLALLQSYLDDTDHAWDGALHARLGVGVPSGGTLVAHGDDGCHARMHAQAIRVQRWARQHLTVTQLLAHRPPDEDFAHRWLRLKFCQVLVQALQREEAPLLPRLLDILADQPPEFVEACQRVCGQVVSYAPVLEGLTHVVSMLRDEEPLDPKKIAMLAEELDPYATGHKVASLFQCIAALFSLEWPAASDWKDRRSTHLQTVDRLVRHVLRSAGPPSSYARFCDALRQFLPTRPIPADLEPHALRHAWLTEATGRVATAQPVSAVADGTWAPIIERLAAQIQRRLRKIVHLEAQHVATLVRPFVRFRKIERIGRKEVRLHLELLGEGVARKSDVQLEIAALGTDGLLDLPGAVRRWSRNLAAYPGERLDLELRGGLGGAQTTVTVTATTRAREYEHVETWSVPLPPLEAAAPVGDMPFPSGLPQAFEAICKTLFEPRRGVHVLVADPDLGQDAFVLAGVERYRGVRFDLDAWLGGLASGATLRRPDAERLVETVANAVPPGQAPLVLVPVAEAWGARTRGPEGGDCQRVVLECLRRRVLAQAEARIVWVVSSQEASAWASLPGTLAHRPSEPASTEIQAWLETQCDLNAREATFALVRLGGDLRLLRLWARALRERRVERGRAEELLQTFYTRPDVFRLLSEDLAALSPYELLWTMAGAIYETRLPLRDVEPGQVAHETLYSHPTAGRRQPKIIGREGQTFTAASLSDLRSDPQPPADVLVEGIGPWSMCNTRYASRLSELLPHLARGRTLADCLERFGQRSGAVWRTAAPYRALIRQLYSGYPAARKSAGNAPSADALVFRALRAEREALLDSLSLAEIVNIEESVLTIALPTVLPAEHRRLRRLAAAWVGTGRDGLDDLLRDVFGPTDARPPVTDRHAGADALVGHGASGETLAVVAAEGEPSPASGRRDGDLLALGQRDGARLLVGGGAVDAGFYNDYLYWLERGDAVALEDFQAALDDFVARNKDKRDLGDRQSTPRVRLTGPGAAGLERDDEQRIAVLNEADVRWAAATGDLRSGLERRTRAQLKLSQRSPFRTTGPLPAGSALFVGRQSEIQFIREGLRERSFLIVGSRRIGKTSLLNQVAAWIDTQSDLLAVVVDLQGVGTDPAFQHALSARAERLGLLGSGAPPESALEQVVQEAQRRKRTPVFLFNEIDRLLHGTPSVFERFRALHEQRQARFVMVGYAVALHAMENAIGSLHHFTEGLATGERAITLKGLADGPARALIDLLERAPLELQWKDDAQRVHGYDLLLDRSYRIPWLLQSMCRDLVLRLERERRDVLTSDDVDAVVGQGSPALWQYLTELDYDVLGLPDADRGVLGLRSSEGTHRRSNIERALWRPGVQLVLLALARERYFLGQGGAPPAIGRADLAHRSPLADPLGFTIADATEVVHDALRQILLPHEQRPVREWFDRLNLRDLFRMLTLTLVVEPDPLNADRFGFLLHIYPRELHRRLYALDPHLDGKFADQAREFWSLFALARPGATQEQA